MGYTPNTRKRRIIFDQWLSSVMMENEIEWAYTKELSIITMKLNLLYEQRPTKSSLNRECMLSIDFLLDLCGKSICLIRYCRKLPAIIFLRVKFIVVYSKESLWDVSRSPCPLDFIEYDWDREWLDLLFSWLYVRYYLKLPSLLCRSWLINKCWSSFFYR